MGRLSKKFVVVALAVFLALPASLAIILAVQKREERKKVAKEKMKIEVLYFAN